MSYSQAGYSPLNSVSVLAYQRLQVLSVYPRTAISVEWHQPISEEVNTIKAITLYFVRHGETYFNQFQQFQGWSDSPLTPTGIQQVQQLATALKGLPISGVYASDLLRSRQTASIICHHATWQAGSTHYLSDLREPFYGSFEGQPLTQWEKIANQHGYQSYEQLVMQFGADQAQDWLSAADPSRLAETSTDFWRRLTTGLSAILSERADQSQLLIISHSAVIRALVARYAPELLDPVTPANGRLSQLTLSQAAGGGIGVTVNSYNQRGVNAPI
ncbi:histidine phosphatase family protein [Lactiplantibacillus plajomi]